MLPWASRSSILWFLGSHSLDTLRWFFHDEVKRVVYESADALEGEAMMLSEDLILYDDIRYDYLIVRVLLYHIMDLHNRWSPPFHAAHEAVDRGELGNIYSAYMRLNDIKWVATDMLPWASALYGG